MHDARPSISARLQRLSGPSCMHSLHTRPSPLHSPPAGGSQLSCAGDRTCVISADNALTCWGAPQAQAPPPDFTQNVASVSVGPTHTCAILNDNRMQCWYVCRPIRTRSTRPQGEQFLWRTAATTWLLKRACGCCWRWILLRRRPGWHAVYVAVPSVLSIHCTASQRASAMRRRCPQRTAPTSGRQRCLPRDRAHVLSNQCSIPSPAGPPTRLPQYVLA